MNRPEVWFAIPSANPEKCRRSLPVWREMGYKVAVLQNRERAEIPADIVRWSDSYPGWAGSINILCKEVVPTSAPIVVSGGDDMLPDPSKTAQQIAEEFLEHFADSPGGTFGVMQPHGDSYDPPTVCGSPWLGREWFTRMYRSGGGMCGAYRHFWADDELYWVSRCWSALWIRPDLKQHHEHFFRTGEAMPGYWKANVQGNDARDTQMFIARHAMGFPGHEPITPIAGRGFDASVFAKYYTQRAETHWRSHFAHSGPSPADERMRETLAACKQRGIERVVLFGAGQHTRKCAQALLDPPVRVLGIVDQNPKIVGTRIWNYPVISIEQALELRPQAVVLSSDSAEDRLAVAAQPMVGAGIELVDLYGKAAGALAANA
jgi:hypothetical protein